MEHSEAYERGMAVRRELGGEAYTAERDKNSYGDAPARAFIDVATELIFGQIWTRPGLDMKTRTLVTLVADAALGNEELDVHLRMALRQGWTEAEITEVFVHLIGYVGAPRARQAFIRARPVFAAHRQETGG